jgi:hypothetical protein
MKSCAHRLRCHGLVCTVTRTLYLKSGALYPAGLRANRLRLKKPQPGKQATSAGGHCKAKRSMRSARQQVAGNLGSRSVSWVPQAVRKLAGGASLGTAYQSKLFTNRSWLPTNLVTNRSPIWRGPFQLMSCPLGSTQNYRHLNHVMAEVKPRLGTYARFPKIFVASRFALIYSDKEAWEL